MKITDIIYYSKIHPTLFQSHFDFLKAITVYFVLVNIPTTLNLSWQNMLWKHVPFTKMIRNRYWGLFSMRWFINAVYLLKIVSNHPTSRDHCKTSRVSRLDAEYKLTCWRSSVTPIIIIYTTIFRVPKIVPNTNIRCTTWGLQK